MGNLNLGTSQDLCGFRIDFFVGFFWPAKSISGQTSTCKPQRSELRIMSLKYFSTDALLELKQLPRKPLDRQAQGLYIKESELNNLCISNGGWRLEIRSNPMD